MSEASLGYMASCLKKMPKKARECYILKKTVLNRGRSCGLGNVLKLALFKT